MNASLQSDAKDAGSRVRETIRWMEWSARAGLVLVVVSLFFLARYPYLNDEPRGEEGMWAALAVFQPDMPDYLLAGRIDGHRIFDPPWHPAPIYELQKGMARLAHFVLPGRALGRIASLRSIYSLFLLFVVVGLLLILSMRKSHFVGMCFLAVFLTFPMTVITTSQLQVDGSVGVLLYGAFGLVQYVATQFAAGKRQQALLVLSGFFLGIGKNEWSVLGILTLVVGSAYVVFGRFLHKRPARDSDLVHLGLTLLGLAFGNALSYGMDPYNYAQGFLLMTRMSAENSILNQGKLHDLLENLASLVPAISACLFSGLLAWGLLIFTNRKAIFLAPLHHFLPVVLASGTVAAFLLSTWSHAGDVRYFSPALVLFGTSVVLQMTKTSLGKSARWAIGIVAVVIVVKNLGMHYRHVPSVSPVLELPQQPGCVWFVSSAKAWNAHYDFWGDAWDRDSTERRLAPLNKTLCVRNSK